MGVNMIFSMDNGGEQGHVGTRKFGGQDGGFGCALTDEHELQVGLSHPPPFLPFYYCFLSHPT